MNITCSQCQSTQMTPGFLMDYGGRGFVKYVQGRLERGILGGAKLFGRPKTAVEAFRCVNCSHLEFFAPDL